MCGKSEMVQLLLDKGKRGRKGERGDPLLIRHCQSVEPNYKGGPFVYKTHCRSVGDPLLIRHCWSVVREKEGRVLLSCDYLSTPLSLSPGVDIDLKDSSGKTVMDFLQDYNSPRANDIKKIIQGTCLFACYCLLTLRKF